MPTRLGPGQDIAPLAVPVYFDAGDVHGIGLACSFSGNAMQYLIVNDGAEGPPVWVSESEIDDCYLQRG